MIGMSRSHFSFPSNRLDGRGGVSGAVASCVQAMRNPRGVPAAPNATRFRGLQQFAAPLISARFARLFGLSRRQKTSPLWLAAAFGLRRTKSRASKNRRSRLRSLSLIKCLVAISFLAVPAANARPLDANGNVVGHRPHGCPYQFCGCEASLYLFGRIIPDLNLAANWLRKFPRTVAAPGMVAARRHHVMVLIRHVRGDVWLTHDGNSGHHLTREHARSIRGFVIVNPRERFAGVVQ